MGASYILEGRESELRQHANQLVEISGRIDNGSSNSASSSPTETGSASASNRSQSNGANAQRLQVESVRMIASTCSK